jgi:DNA repair and recombination protein RAD54B
VPRPLAKDKSQPMSRVEKMLAALDSNTTSDSEEGETLSIRDVPGGTVSFLFERTTEVAEDDDEDASNNP